MSVVQLAGLACSIGGVIVLGYTPGENVITNFTLGIFCALLCCVGWASEAVICAYGLKDPDVSDEHALQIRQITSAVFYGIVILTILKGWKFTLDIAFTSTTAIILLSALFGTASYVCYYRAIATIGATKAMALNITYSAWSIIFSIILLHTLPDVKSVICGIVIVLGSVVAAGDIKEFLSKGKRA